MVSLERKRPATLADSLAISLRAHAPVGAPESLAGTVRDAVGNTGSLKRAQIAYLAGKSLGVSAAANEKIACAIEYWVRADCNAASHCVICALRASSGAADTS